jgi:hypothetical protein
MRDARAALIMVSVMAGSVALCRSAEFTVAASAFVLVTQPSQGAR